MTDVTTSDGVRLYAEATGSGLPVLFIHEFAADHRTWSRQVGALSGTFRCITYAARGYPPSEAPPEQERYNYLRQADDAIDVLDAFGIARAHVVGLSMGGFCALQLGIRYPHRVSSLLVASAGSGASPRGRAAFLAETEQMAAALRTDGMAAVSAKQAMGPNRIQLRRKNRQAWEEFAGQLAEHSAEGMALTVTGIQRSRPSLYDITGQLAGITAPTLVVNGDEDEACLEPGLLLKRVIPRAGLAVVPNSGHALNLEEPELFNDLIRTLAGAAEAGTWPTRDPRSLSASMGIANAGTGTWIRLAGAADAAEIARIHMASRAAAMPYLPPQERSHEQVTQWVRDIVLRTCRVWVAVRDTEILGYAALEGDVLEHLYLLPEARRQGTGTLLLDTVRRHRPEGVSLHVFQRNTDARAFYERHGFTVAGTSDGRGNMENLPDMTLRWTPDSAR